MIFISYSSKDKNIAKTVKGILEEENFSCWMAPESVTVGGDYSKEIPEAIERCKVFLLLLSENSQSSAWVPKELDTVMKTYDVPKKIIPFRIDGCSLTKEFAFRLSDIQILDGNEANLSESYPKLIKRLNVFDEAFVEIGTFPDKISILEMIGENKIVSSYFMRNWNATNSGISFDIGVGLTQKGDIYAVDLKQYMNMIVLGPSGCGKTEFLNTLILSSICDYSVKNIEFIMISFKGWVLDYKLPNVIYTDSIMTKYEFHKFLVCLNDIIEKQYRKVFFREKRNHLIVIIDEIAEALAMFPEETANLIKTLECAETYGIRYIMTSQLVSVAKSIKIHKSRTLFCLSDRLSREEFAELPNSIDFHKRSECPGRFVFYDCMKNQNIYVQVAYSEPYNSIFIEAIKNAINYIGTDLGNKKLLFMPRLEKYYYLPQIDVDCVFSDKIKMDKKKWEDVTIEFGIMDDYENYSQKKAVLNISKDNAVILGNNSTGKTTLLFTLLFELAQKYSSSEINMYYIDMDFDMDIYLEEASNMSYKTKFIPQLKDVLRGNQEEEIRSLFNWLVTELENRRKKYNRFNVQSWVEYNNLNNGNEDIHIIVFIDHLSLLSRLYCIGNTLKMILQKGPSCGISVIMTENNLWGVEFSYLYNSFSKILLYTNIDDHYISLFGDNEANEQIPGRCMWKRGKKSYYVQTYCWKKDNEIEDFKNRCNCINSLYRDSGKDIF